MTRRRTVVKGLAVSVPLCAIGNSAVTAADEVSVSESGRDYFRELGLTRFINAAGAYSAFGGARMRPEVITAMRYAANHKVKMRELHDAVGTRLASLVGSEAAMVTSGATASMVIGTAACMTLGDEERMRQLPDATDMKNEVIIQKRHRYTYDRALTVAGAKLVEVSTESDIENAVNDRTAMMFFLKPTRKGDDIPALRYIDLARKLGIPSFCDAATTTPPATNVIDGVSEGFDLICYSGGKGLRGPYSAGLLLGRKDLIQYARRHAAPNDISIGRGMKVSAEEYLGMLVAVEEGLRVNESDEHSWKRDRFNVITDVLTDVRGVSTNIFVSEGHAKELYLDIDWNAEIVSLSRDEFVQALRDHNPSVEIRARMFSGGRIHLSATVMEDGEDAIVAQIIRRVLLAHT